MNKTRGLIRLAALAGLALTLILTPGCSDKKEKKDEKPRSEKRDLARISALASQLRQLDESLARMKQETDAQQSRINAVQGDIAAARQTLSDLNLTYRPAPGDAVAVDPARAAARDKDAVEARDRREKAENRTLDTLVIICFLAAVGAIGYSLWYRRGKNGGEPEPDAPLPFTPVPPSATVVVPPTEPSEVPESAPYKEEPKEPPSPF